MSNIEKIHQLASIFTSKNTLNGQDMREMFCLVYRERYKNPNLRTVIRTVTENGYDSGEYMEGWTSECWANLDGAMTDLNPNKNGYQGDGKDLGSCIKLCYSPDEGNTYYIFGTCYNGHGPNPHHVYKKIKSSFVSGSKTFDCISYVKA